MKIVIDDKIPFIRGIFEPHAGVLYVPGGLIGREHLIDADCLLVRTRTRCDQELLRDTRVRFIGTATIGFDHIDTEWCGDNGIAWTNAPGCNSGAVAQYVSAALNEMAGKLDFNLKEKTLGIVGVGHVGRKVERFARETGMKVILNDPPRERSEGPGVFSSLPELLSDSDIITIHVPLNRGGPDQTADLVDRNFLGSTRHGAILINTSRGEVIDEGEAVRMLKGSGRLGGMVLDVWKNEPDINLELMELVDIATPHIAGYSVDGKYNATKMMVDAVSNYFQINLAPLPPLTRDGLVVKQSGPMAAYDIMADDHRLRESPETFEPQRNNYPQRWEYAPTDNRNI